MPFIAAFAPSDKSSLTFVRSPFAVAAMRAAPLRAALTSTSVAKSRAVFPSCNKERERERQQLGKTGIVWLVAKYIHSLACMGTSACS